MGILFGERPRSTDVHNLSDVEIYGLSNFTNNETTLKVYDSIEVPLNAIRKHIIATQPPSKLKFIMDYS